MQSSTIGIILLIFAAVTFSTGIGWLAIVFLALGMAMLFLYKEAQTVPEAPKAKHAPANVQAYPQAVPPQTVIVHQEEGLAHALAEKIVEHEFLSKARKHKK